MALTEEMEAQGNWLFRWRSYLPLLMLAAVLAAAFGERPYSGYPNRWFELFCFVGGLGGVMVRTMVAGFVPKRTSGRNTEKGQVADSLNTTGIYSVVRHPLYLGNYLLWMSCVAVVGEYRLVIILTLVYWLYYERIMMAEEGFLRGKFGEAYDEWAKGRPAFVPRPSGWQTAELPFCWRTALKREYSSVFAWVSAFAISQHVPALAKAKHLSRIRPDAVWTWVLLGTAVAYLGVRYLRKKRFLSISGR